MSGATSAISKTSPALRAEENKMKFWKRTALCLALCAALLTGCVPAADTASSAAPTDPLTGQEALWPGQRPVAVTIENETSSTTQWGFPRHLWCWKP